MTHYIKHFAALLLTAMFSILPTRADVIINEENFPDANFRNFLLTDTHNNIGSSDHCNVNGYGADGVLTNAEIAKITHITCASKNIASLKGIELFTSLTWLDCEKNQLTALDVTKNTALTTLKCSSNQLTAMDVTKNTKLVTFYCDNNQLSALDVTENIALSILWCHYNKLTALDVTKNTALTELSCDNNQLTALDVTKNTKLTNLSCSNNKLTELDVTKNTALKSLSCGDNQLTEINITHNIELQQLYCGDNPLGKLDLTQNTKLVYLRCRYNQLTDLDLSIHSSLYLLDCSNNQLTKLDVTKNTKLQQMSCYNNLLTELDMTKNTKLTNLYCENNRVTQLEVSQNTALTNLRCYNNQLVELDLSNNPGIKSTFFGVYGQHRDIQAEVGWTGINNEKVKFYYLSLDALAGQGDGMQTLAQKLLVDNHADEWWSRVNKETMTGATVLTGSRNAATAGDIDPSTVYGSILVLTPTKETETSASGSMTYAYDMRYTGANTTVQQRAADNNFTLNWTADPQVITNVLRLGDDVEVPVSAVHFVNLSGQVSDTPWQGVNIVVKRHSDGTTETSKVIR